jgi:hypothetical protein
MPLDNPTIIADRSAGFGRLRAERRAAGVALGLALAIGVGAAAYYAAADLTLSHYDARAHLVVARRVADSLTPGWRQLGAVWLPLPHAANALPVQWDWAYRTGATGVALSIGVLAWGLACLSAYLRRHTGSTAASLAMPAALLANPNLLYLQSTPMTEPLLIGLSLAALEAVDRWTAAGDARQVRVAGALLVALVLTRYEGWLIGAGLVGLAMLSKGPSALTLARAPAMAIAAFLLLSRASTGVWFVTSGFFEPNNPSRHQAGLVLEDIVTATAEIAGEPMIWAGAAGALACVWCVRRSRDALLPLALAGAAALPFAAFYQGHPHRVRYMVPLAAALVVVAARGLAAAPARSRGAIAVALLGIALWTRPPLDATAPMVVEAQWETPWRVARQEVTRELMAVYDGTPILASMGSLGHYMQEASEAGLSLRQFLHEGNGDLWADALRWPHRHVRWILIEERAEGGDVLAQLARQDETFLAGFERVTEHGGLALYRRQ